MNYKKEEREKYLSYIMSWEEKKIKKGKKAVIRDRNQSPNERIAVSHIQKIGKLRQHRRQNMYAHTWGREYLRQKVWVWDRKLMKNCKVFGEKILRILQRNRTGPHFLLWYHLFMLCQHPKWPCTMFNFFNRTMYNVLIF